jgi:hypothetical protein
MKRGAEYTKIIDRKTGIEYDLHTISDGGTLYQEAPRGTHVVKNPRYNGEPQYLFFQPGDIEPIYPAKSSASWFEQQQKRQDEAFSKGDPIYPD